MGNSPADDPDDSDGPPPLLSSTESEDADFDPDDSDSDDSDDSDSDEVQTSEAPAPIPAAVETTTASYGYRPIAWVESAAGSHEHYMFYHYSDGVPWQTRNFNLAAVQLDLLHVQELGRTSTVPLAADNNASAP